AFSRSARLLLTDHGGQARVWDPATGKPVGPPFPHNPSNPDQRRFYKRAAVIRPDGQHVLTLVTVGPHQLTRAVEAETGKTAWELPSSVQQIDYSADGRWAVLATGSGQRVLAAATGTGPAGVAYQREAGYAAVSADGRRVAVGISGGGIYVSEVF